MNINKVFGIKPTVDTKRLITTLTNSKIATENNSLYQTIFRLINDVSKFEKSSNETLTTIQNVVSGGGGSGGGGGNPGLANANYLTTVNNQSQLPNSRQILAGTNITFTDNGTTFTIATVPLVSTDYVVMSDGDVTNPQPMNDGNGNFIYVPYTP